ncbi:MAG: glycosyltransferase family 4 protein [Promethearchaeota archaeon]
MKRILLTFKSEIVFLVEESNWAIEWVGNYITHNLRKFYSINAEIGSQYFAKRKIIHYGAITCLFRKNSIINLDKTNNHILSWHHIPSDETYAKLIRYLNTKLDLIQTSNIISKKKLIEFGFEEKKIVVIPLGVDLLKFKRYNKDKRKQLKKKFELPEDKIIIGSFQKDDWKNGIPVERKGPDIFCEVMEELNKNFEIHILLTGPGRIYIKNRLEKNKIPYTHIFLNNYWDVVECYNVLDLYLITSRNEGGPLALLESMATGVPVVTTRMGMAPELINNGINGFITDIDDVKSLYESSVKIIENDGLREDMIKNAINTVQDYSWEKITKEYYKKIYKRFLET